VSDVSIGFGPISGVSGAAQELLLHFGHQPQDHPDIVAELEQGLGEAALDLAHEVLPRHGLSVTGPSVSSQDTPPAPRPARTWKRGLTPAYPQQVARVAKLVLAKRFAANSFVMRHLHLGFSETEACLNILESWGVVGPREGSKARRILVEESETDAIVSALTEVLPSVSTDTDGRGR